jgi:CubicO group peptidase (beta-lactamase class C family)
MTANTLSHASTTKPFTGTAVMLLIEVGKFDLNTPVKEYFNWQTFREKGAAERITLCMLMSHTAGLPDLAEYFIGKVAQF